MHGAEPSSGPEHMVVGQVTKAHGIKGEVFVHVLTDNPDHIFADGNDLLIGDAKGGLGDDPEVVTIERARSFKRGLLVKFEDLQSREDVEDMAMRYLLVPADAVAPLEPGELFYHQLLGRAVVTTDGQTLGSVREVYETDASHLLEIVGDDGKVRLIPLVHEMVRELDADGPIEVEPLPGLLDL